VASRSRTLAATASSSSGLASGFIRTWISAELSPSLPDDEESDSPPPPAVLA
jgi:hypothetical protein